MFPSPRLLYAAVSFVQLVQWAASAPVNTPICLRDDASPCSLGFQPFPSNSIEHPAIKAAKISVRDVGVLRSNGSIALIGRQDDSAEAGSEPQTAKRPIRIPRDNDDDLQSGHMEDAHKLGGAMISQAPSGDVF